MTKFAFVLFVRMTGTSTSLGMSKGQAFYRTMCLSLPVRVCIFTSSKEKKRTMGNTVFCPTHKTYSLHLQWNGRWFEPDHRNIDPLLLGVFWDDDPHTIRENTKNMLHQTVYGSKRIEIADVVHVAASDECIAFFWLVGPEGFGDLVLLARSPLDVPRFYALLGDLLNVYDNRSPSIQQLSPTWVGALRTNHGVPTDVHFVVDHPKQLESILTQIPAPRKPMSLRDQWSPLYHWIRYLIQSIANPENVTFPQKTDELRLTGLTKPVTDGLKRKLNMTVSYGETEVSLSINVLRETMQQAHRAYITEEEAGVGPNMFETAYKQSQNPNKWGPHENLFSHGQLVTVSGPVCILADENQTALNPLPPPVWCVSAPGINFKYSRQDMSTFMEQRVPPVPNATGRRRMRVLWHSILSAFQRGNVKVPVLMAIGCGAFRGAIMDVAKYYAEALKDCLDRDSYGFQAVVVSLVDAEHHMYFERVFASTTSTHPPVLLSRRGMIGIALALTQNCYRCGILNPSDAQAVLQGSMGMYWLGKDIAVEELLAVQTTLLFQHRDLNPDLWNNKDMSRLRSVSLPTWLQNRESPQPAHVLALPTSWFPLSVYAIMEPLSGASFVSVGVNATMVILSAEKIESKTKLPFTVREILEQLAKMMVTGIDTKSPWNNCAYSRNHPEYLAIMVVKRLEFKPNNTIAFVFLQSSNLNPMNMNMFVVGKSRDAIKEDMETRYHNEYEVYKEHMSSIFQEIENSTETFPDNTMQSRFWKEALKKPPTRFALPLH